MAVAAEGLLENKQKMILQAEICIFSSARANCSECDFRKTSQKIMQR